MKRRKRQFESILPDLKKKKTESLFEQLNFLLFKDDVNEDVHILITERDNGLIIVQVSREFTCYDIVFNIKQNKQKTAISFYNVGFVIVDLEIPDEQNYRQLFSIQFDRKWTFTRRLNHFYEEFGLFLSARRCPHIFMEDYEKLRNHKNLKNRTKLEFHWKKKAAGEIVVVNDESYFKAHDCCLFIRGKEQRSSQCNRLSNYILRMENHQFLKVVLNERKYSQFDKDELVLEIRNSLESGKLVAGSGLYKTITEQAKMCQRDPYHMYTNHFPHTLSMNVNDLINGSSSRKWEKENDKWIFKGNLMQHSRQSLNKVLNLFRYGPGIQQLPMEVALILFEAMEVEQIRIQHCGDSMHPNQGLEEYSLYGMNMFVGVQDYGTLGPAMDEFAAQLEGMWFSSDEKLQDNFLEELDCSVKRMKKKDSSKITLAKYYTQHYLSCQLKCKDVKETILMYLPIFYFFESSSTKENYKFMFETSMAYVMNKIAEGKRNGLGCCQKVSFDSTIYDSDPAIISYWNEKCKRTTDLESFEMPYVLQFVTNSGDVEGESLKTNEVTCSNDGSHMLKELRNKFKESTGISSSRRCILYPCKSKESNKWYLKPVTWRCLVAVYRLESSTPSQMKVSRLSKSAVEPDEREKMRTRLASAVFCERTMNSLERLLERYDALTLGISEVIAGVRLTKNEIEGCISFINDVRKFYNAIMKKVIATKRDLNIIILMKEKWIKWVKLSESKILKKNNFCGYDTVRKCIRVFRCFEFNFNRINMYIPYRTNSQDCVENHFMDTRCERGHYDNVNFREVIVRYPRIYLRKQNLALRRHSSYDRCGGIDLCNIILKQEIMLKISNIHKEVEVKMKRYIENIIDVELDQPSKVLLDLHMANSRNDVVYFGHFCKRTCMLLGTCQNICNSTKREFLVPFFGYLISEENNLGVVVDFRNSGFPRKEIVHLLMEIDHYICINFKGKQVHKVFVFIKEILKRSISNWFEGNYVSIIRNEMKKRGETVVNLPDFDGNVESSFLLLILVWVKWRLNDLCHQIHINSIKGVRSFRNQRNKKASVLKL